MFFFLSKTIGLGLLPTNFLIGSGLLGIALLATRYARAGRRLMVFSILLLAIAGFSPLGNWLLYPLEQRFPPWDAARGAPYGIIVLGGSIDADLSAAHNGAVVRSGADRIIAAAVLARRYPDAHAHLLGRQWESVSTMPERPTMPVRCLKTSAWTRRGSRWSTLAQHPGERRIFQGACGDGKRERWLLVTSAYHMPRSIGLFRKAGFAVEAYPVDWRIGNRADLWAFSAMAGEGLGYTDIGLREWIGLLAYWLTGRITSPSRDR